MDRLGNLKHVEELRQLICNQELYAGTTCRQRLGYPGDSNIWLLTPVGEARPVYRVECPRNQGEEYCPGTKLVVFLPEIDDPEEEARARADAWFIEYCQVKDCGATVDWEDWEEAELVGDGDEIRFLARCQPNRKWWQRLLGLKPSDHSYVINLAWIEDEDDDWEKIPDHLPADIISPRQPVTA